jgi:hypothetical protein
MQCLMASWSCRMQTGDQISPSFDVAPFCSDRAWCSTRHCDGPRCSWRSMCSTPDGTCGSPLQARKERLQAVIAPTHGGALFAVAVEQDLEGIVAGARIRSMALAGKRAG